MTEFRVSVYFSKARFQATWVLSTENRKKIPKPNHSTDRVVSQRTVLFSHDNIKILCVAFRPFLLLLENQEPCLTLWFSELSPPLLLTENPNLKFLIWQTRPPFKWMPIVLAYVNHPYISLLWAPRNALLLFQQQIEIKICGVVSLDESVVWSPWMRIGTLLHWFWLKWLTMAILVFTPHLCV